MTYQRSMVEPLLRLLRGYSSRQTKTPAALGGGGGVKEKWCLVGQDQPPRCSPRGKRGRNGEIWGQIWAGRICVVPPPGPELGQGSPHCAPPPKKKKGYMA